jgi:hypothetical protein
MKPMKHQEFSVSNGEVTSQICGTDRVAMEVSNIKSASYNIFGPAKFQSKIVSHLASNKFRTTLRGCRK